MARLPLQNVLFLLLVPVFLSLIVACSKNDSSIGIANPASVHCEESGGTSKIVQNEDGAVGLCNFTDSSICDEWAFYRGECAPGYSLKSQNRWDFSCPDGYQFTVLFPDNSQQIIVETPDDRKILTQTRSASGARYNDGDFIFWNKGTSAHIEQGGQIIHAKCLGERI